MGPGPTGEVPRIWMWPLHKLVFVPPMSCTAANKRHAARQCFPRFQNQASKGAGNTYAGIALRTLSRMQLKPVAQLFHASHCTVNASVFAIGKCNLMHSSVAHARWRECNLFTLALWPHAILCVALSSPLFATFQHGFRERTCRAPKSTLAGNSSGEHTGSRDGCEWTAPG